MLHNKKDKLFYIIGFALLFCIMVAGILFAISTFTIGVTAKDIPASVILNEDSDFLSVNDVWTVDSGFSVWIDNIEEVSADTVKDRYPELSESSSKRYFKVSFSFENIDFSGCKTGDKIFPYLTVIPAAVVLDDRKDPVWPSNLQTYCQGSYTLPLKDCDSSTESQISENNTMFVEIDTQPLSAHYLAIRFVVPVEKLSTEAAIQYRQDFLYPIP